MDYIIMEMEETRKEFDFEDILKFQIHHDVQIIRGEDWQYQCYIDKKGYGSALTCLGALVFGIKQYRYER